MQAKLAHFAMILFEHLAAVKGKLCSQAESMSKN